MRNVRIKQLEHRLTIRIFTQQNISIFNRLYLRLVYKVIFVEFREDFEPLKFFKIAN